MAGRGRFLRAKRVRALALALGALLLAGCNPILHPQFNAREGPTSPVTFELLSGDGNFAVVRSTGPSATVPAAGRWRIDRRDGSLVALPSGDRGVKISRDGSRVLVRTGAGSVVWASGTSLSPPAGAVFSPDLTFAVFVDTDGAVKTWNTATQAIGLVETGFARPAGTTGAAATGISDDGRTVEYTLRGVHPVERFVDLDGHTAFDVPNHDGAGGSNDYVIDRFALAADGAGLVHAHEEGFFDFDALAQIVEVSWAELVELPLGTVVRRYTNRTQESMSRVFIAANGKEAWIYQSRSEPDGSVPSCPVTPATTFCVVASHVAVVRGSGARTFDTGAGELGSIGISSSGRFLVLDREILPVFGIAPKGPVQVVDGYASVETLDQAVTYQETHDDVKCRVFGFSGAPCTVPAYSTGAQVSDDLRVIATTTNTGQGWYEYSAAPVRAPVVRALDRE